MSCLSALFSKNCIFVFVYLCICVFVFVYFDVRHLGTLFLRSSNNILFKNIAHDRSISKFYPNCICVFVYLCICICVFGHPRLISDQLELFVTSPFSSTFLLGHSKWPKKCWKHFPIEQVLFYISPCNRCVSRLCWKGKNLTRQLLEVLNYGVKNGPYLGTLSQKKTSDFL